MHRSLAVVVFLSFVCPLLAQAPPQAPQAAEPDAPATIKAVVEASRLDELRWPDFSDYNRHLRKFYDANGNGLWWVRELEPTRQAQQLIALLLHAGQKGLSADDYDGPRWSGRLAKLKPAVRQPAEADAVQFDLALTICAMRYIFDLHIGKVNPKHFAFGFDEEPIHTGPRISDQAIS